MKRFDQFYYKENHPFFHTYLPIQLDGTCNGFQHLALLSDEVEVFEELNLTEASTQDDPRDLYSFILNKIKIQLNSKLNETRNKDDVNCIQRLLELDLDRSHIKMLIMTKPYNATWFTLTNYLVDSLIYRGYGVLEIKDGESILKTLNHGESTEIEKSSEIEKEELPQEYQEFTKYIADSSTSKVVKKKTSKGKSAKDSGEHTNSKASSFYSTSIESKHLVSRQDLAYFVNEFNRVLFIHYPNIKNLMDYLAAMADIMTNLNLPIV